MLCVMVFLFDVECVCFIFIFFCKQKTAYEMRISDCSSDVCSSDLLIWPMLGIAIAGVGGVLNFLGWYIFDSRVLSLAGFYIAVAGIVFGGAAIVVRSEERRVG